ncbi:class I SAM-dependent methyltransferase [Gaetbulibacter jejuensis]|uniref:Methyltransferase type 11 domain-containing protein n=1 Tax=Gaetbulibacter jejuensis TaxID=584607 RepID=A0ABP3V7K1_9FLAO
MTKIYKRIQQSLKTRWLLFKDELEVRLGKRHPLLPPRRYNYINSGVNSEINQEFFNYFKDLCGLQPTDSVLEVGSGFGRMAIPLTEYLSTEGRYEGLEIIQDGVNWCTSKFTTRYPNFKFQYIDVYNERYNPKGRQEASNFLFPYNNETFDFVYLTSVFTHMFYDDVAHYLSEINRVLTPGGVCLITYFILDDISLMQIRHKRGVFSFRHDKDGAFIEDMQQPEYAVAYTLDTIRSLYKTHKLEIQSPIRYGNWSGREPYLSFQDIVIARKL